MEKFIAETIGLPAAGIIFLLLFVLCGRLFMHGFQQQPKPILRLLVTAVICVAALYPMVLWDFRG